MKSIEDIEVTNAAPAITEFPFLAVIGKKEAPNVV